MHISAISSDYAQIMKALGYSGSCGKDKQCSTNEALSEQEKCAKKMQIYAAIAEWQNFCQQQILKTNLDITI